MPTPTIDEAMDEASAWADIEGVVAVYPTKRDGRDCIEVRVTGSREDLAGRIPETLHGYPVVVIDLEPPISAEEPG